MLNPYNPPRFVDDATDKTRGAIVLTHLMWLACMTIGFAAGMHLAFTLHRGYDSAVGRMTAAPIGNLLFAVAAAVVCTLLVASWKTLRRRFLADYIPSAMSRLATGLIFALVMYFTMGLCSKLLNALLGSTVPEITSWLALLSSVLIATLAAGETEAAWFRYRIRSKSIADDK